MGEPACYGPDSVTVVEFTPGLRNAQELLAAHDGEDAAVGRLRAAFTAHQTPDGVFPAPRPGS
ncbi:hypothetical protein [Amycolatopsis sp. NBC_00438]|uniref:hypothetical protein n=1 Tax=Amycolatopsis sp. NBC_00438 TaxID=2903558 RepID=UPI002E224109